MLKKIIILIYVISFTLVSFDVKADEPIRIRDIARNIVNDMPSGPPFILDTEIGSTESELINKYIINMKWLSSTFIKSIENINSEYKLFILEQEESAGITGVYIINNNTGKVVGYSIFGVANTGSMTLDLINTIKSFTFNKSYLESQIIQTEKATIKFYDKYHSENEFIERYAIMTEEDGSGIKIETLVIDSYYPSILEEYIAPKFVRTINNVLDKENRYWNGEELPIEFRY